MDAITNYNIDQITAQIIAHKQIAGRSIMEIGRLLIAAKATVPHGQWGSYLKDQVEFSERQAQNFMRVAREYEANPQLVADLGSIRKAIALLEVPADERETFAAEHNAATCSARELEEAVKAKDKALEDLATKEAALKTANSCLAGKDEELAQVRQELKELKNRPIEVAVETVTVVDEAAVKKAARDAAKEAKVKAEAKAAKELGAEKAKVKQLEAELAAARQNSDKARADAAEAELEKTRRALDISQNEDVLSVKICFEQIKETANRMQGYILRLKAKGKEDEYDKCCRTWRALAQAMMQAAQGV